jgi:hypothetical protein
MPTPEPFRGLDRRLPLVAVVCTGFLYAALRAFAVGPIDGFWAVDQGVRLEQVQSLLENHFRSLATLYPGDVIDPLHHFTPLLGQYLYRNGQSYAMFSAVSAVVNAALFHLLGTAGLYVLPIGSTILLLLLADRLMGDALEPAWRCAVVLGLGLATPLLFYSLTFWDHTLVAMMALLALFLALRSRPERGVRSMAWAGGVLGLATWFRPEIFLGLPALAAAVFFARWPRPWKRSFALAGGALGPLSLQAVFNRAVYGTFWGPHILRAAQATYERGGGLAEFLRLRADWAKQLLAPVLVLGLAGAAVLLALAVAAALPAPVRRTALQRAATVALLAAAAAVAIDRTPGSEAALFVTAPLVMLIFVPAGRNGGSGHVAATLGVFSAVYILAAWLFRLPAGGVQWGPRILLPAVAPLVVAGTVRLASALRSMPRGFFRLALASAAILLLLTGVKSEVAGIAAARQADIDFAQFSEAAEESRQQVIVVGNVAAGSLLAPIFYDGYIIVCGSTPRQLAGVTRLLAARGFQEFFLLRQHGQPPLPGPRDGPNLAIERPPIELPFDYRGELVRID